MDFAALKTELADRGFSDLTDARRGVLINAAAAELDRLHLWPWREKSVTGTAPLSITDLGPIEAVTNETQDYRLRKVDFQTLLDSYGDLSVSGDPRFYYTAWPAGTPAVATYPTNSATIGVQYWLVPPVLTGTDPPTSPADAHYLIVDLAVRRAAKDPERRALAQEEIDRQLDQLLFQYPPGIADGPDAFVGFGAVGDDG